ncbi:hypothetical protein [Cellulosimicrobium funkei]|uniref:hypothetical protein n=1 Tax=Cellulosimicrobium funkei TaxID=264251 RepID=UPI0036C31D87
MSPRAALRSLKGGAVFEWVSEEARLEADALLDADPLARSEFVPLLRRVGTGALRSRDYGQMVMVAGEPYLFELRLRTTSPQLRLYFYEESRDDGLHVVGLMLAPKPSGSLAEQRERQNDDARRAYGRRRST